ncbi:MAG: alpha-2-macroglobulin family protein, partial [Chloroflexota bacterium]|nr:alpha-2-macroglobulin family protein [Chloroflexota bacterium]
MSQHSNAHKIRTSLPTLIVVVLLAAVIACGIVPSPGDDDSSDNQIIPMGQVDDSTERIDGAPAGNGDDDDDGEPGLTIKLSEGQERADTTEPLPVATGEPLSDQEVERVLARLPILTAEPDDEVEFRLPEEILPPPRPGETIEEAFPPPADAAEPESVESRPLEVLRYSPEGEIPIAPFVNVTFNQPMVALTTVEELANEDVPVQIEPQLPGTWRWLGTKTLNFQYDSKQIDRLPMATEYTVTVPAGVESATGNALEQAVQFSFRTPTPTIKTYYPSYDSQPLEPLFFIAFDQRINPQAVLETIQVSAGGESVGIELADDESVAAHETVSYMAENAGEGRWLAFQVENPLPKDTTISVNVGPGTPSAEGPLVTQNAQGYSFQTYAPLQIIDQNCATREYACHPLTPLYFQFNNAIDTEAYAESMLRIEPELPGAAVNIVGNSVQIRGMTQGQTTYRVTVDGDIRDEYGQTLGRDEEIKFIIGSAEPALIGPDQIFVSLDPAASEPVLSLYTINYDRLDVEIYAVEPSDWPMFNQYLREYQQTDNPMRPPGQKVVDETQRTEIQTDVLTEVGIELSEVMDSDYGHFIVIVKPHRGLFEEDRYWETVQVWVQVTQIGLDAFADHSELVVWASSLQDGAPLADINIASNSTDSNATTDANGIARFDIPSAGASYLVARQGKDEAMLPNSTYYWGDGSWQRSSVSDELRWYVFDDRQMYRPGEEVHLKGWMRRIGGGQDGDVGLVGEGVTSVHYQIIGPQGNDYGGGSVDVNELGGFDLAFTMPENANLGQAQIMLDAEGSLGSLSGAQYIHSFQIQEFRRPEFEVTARNETTGPYLVGEHAIVAVEAQYFAGGPLPNAEVNWQLNSTPTNYQPPNWPEFDFGYWEPWWWFYGAGSGGDGSQTQNYSGLTDASGNHFLRLDFENVGEPRPYSLLAESTVFDVNRQAWAGTTSLIVHPADLYVGMRSERYFVERGTPLEIELIVTDLDGNPIPGRLIRVEAARLEWKYGDNGWNQEEVDIQECSLDSAMEPVICNFTTEVGGRYRITATIHDESGRKNQSQFTRWVSGGKQVPEREVEQETVTLIPDKENYQPDDIAEILVQSPFSPAQGLLTVSRSGILYTERFVIEDGSTTLQVPIKEKYIPNLHVQVDVVGSAPRTDDNGEALDAAPPRPAYASGQLNLQIPPLERTLALELSPEETKLEPGGETTLDVLLTNADGQPVADAEFAVVVVDEAILALTDYQLSDPISTFYRDRSSGLSSTYGRSSIVLADPQSLTEASRHAAENMPQPTDAEKSVMEEAEMAAPAPGTTFSDEAMLEIGGAELDTTGASPISVRMDFNPLAAFVPTVRTDQNGAAAIKIELPDNLTRYRVMVVAVDSSGKQFGSAESNLTARLPLMVRPSAPRFLNFGDRIELPVVLQNQTDEPIEANVVVQASNLSFSDHLGLSVTVPANDRLEVRFPAAAEMAGTARFQIAAVSGDYADAASVELPVYTPATTEAFATYGVIDDGAIAQPVAAPENVFPQFGGLEINTSSTALHALSDAVLYLVSYPYECSEQLASRILGVAALRDVLTAFDAEGLPSPEAMEAAVQRDIEKLQGLQNNDGGFPYWRRGRDSIPFNTIHVAHALERAKLKGFEVPEEMQQWVLSYLRDIESYYPYWYSLRTRQTLSAYALYVRNLMGDSDPVKARNLLNEAELENLSLDAIGWIWQVLLDDPGSSADLDAIRQYVGNRVVETAGAANFTTSYHDQIYLLLSSNRRT